MKCRFTNCILKSTVKPLTVVSIEITENDDFRERKRIENVLYSGILIAEEFRINNTRFEDK